MSTVVPFPNASVRPVLPAHRSPAIRCLIEGEIERLIDLLDVIDGDADAEDDGTAEPSLGWSTTMAWGVTDDREEGLR